MEKVRKLPLLLDVLEGYAHNPPPVWLMRQAGRYLPEYRAVRAKAGSFWTMCMTPELAVEVTLQPIRRFDLDAAILFSDILVVPYALGQTVRFEDGHGPMLEPFANVEGLICDEEVWRSKLAPVYQAMREARAVLTNDKMMIGFAGAPWTLAAYMLEGKGSPDQKAAKLAAYRDPQSFRALIYSLIDAVAWHLIRQFEAGADVVQIFDSWAGGLNETLFQDFVIVPNRKIVQLVRKQIPKARIIGFPRGASESGYRRYAAETGVDAVGLDTAVSIAWAADALAGSTAIQGNLDPIALIAGGDALTSGIDAILSATEGKRLIFNLGHGVLPETPPDHVAQMVARIRGAH
jgi:uroporphyrinogen decarboxylase